MNFQAAFNYMKQAGEAISLPEWGGYWMWDDELDTIVIHLRNGEVMDFRDTPDLTFTLGQLARDDWFVVSDTSVTEHDFNAAECEDEEPVFEGNEEELADFLQELFECFTESCDCSECQADDEEDEDDFDDDAGAAVVLRIVVI